MIKKTALLALAILLFNQAFPQNDFKNPVRFKLKNNFTVIVAQNNGSGKIFSRLTVENSTSDEEKLIASVLTDFLAYRANQFNRLQTPNKKIIPEISINASEASTSSDPLDFEQTLSFVSLNLFNPQLAETVFEKMRSVYTGNKNDLKNLELSAIEHYISHHFRSQDIYFTIAGDISPANAKMIANRVFGISQPKTKFLTK